MSKKRSSALVLTVGTAIALTAGGAGAYWFLRQRGGGESLTKTSAELIPQDALVTFSVSTNERQWQQVRSLGTPETQAQFNQQLAKWRAELIEESGLDYNSDIQPWIGNQLTVALLPPPVDVALPESGESSSPEEEDSEELESFTDEGSEQNDVNEIEPAPEDADDALTLDPDVIDPELIDPTQEQLPILIVPIADPLKARAKLSAAFGEDSASIKRDYNGLEIQEFSTDSDFKFATVIDRQMLVLTTEASAIEQVVDTYVGDPSVVDTPGYRQALPKVSNAQAFMEVYLNSAAAATLAAANTVQATPPQGLATLQDGQGVAATITLNGSGFDVKGVSWLREDAENPFSSGKSMGSVVEKLPEDTLLMAAGSDFQQLWQTLDKRANEGIKGPLNPETIRSGFQSFTGLNIDTDLVDWMTGDFAIALVTSAATEDDVQNPGLVLLAQSGDRSTADKTFSALDTVVKDRFRFTVTPETLGEVEVTRWASPFAALSVTRGWLDNNTSFFAVGNIADSLVPKPSTSLANSALFQQVTATDIGAANGYFFVNLEALLGAKSALPIPPLPPQQAATVGAIQAIGLTTNIEDNKTARFNVSVVMPTLDNPGTLPELEATPPATEEEAAEE